MKFDTLLHYGCMGLQNCEYLGLLLIKSSLVDGTQIGNIIIAVTRHWLLEIYYVGALRVRVVAALLNLHDDALSALY